MRFKKFLENHTTTRGSQSRTLTRQRHGNVSNGQSFNQINHITEVPYICVSINRTRFRPYWKTMGLIKPLSHKRNSRDMPPTCLSDVLVVARMSILIIDEKISHSGFQKNGNTSTGDNT